MANMSYCRFENTYSDFDHYEVCSDGFWYKFYERDNAVAFACRHEYPIFGVKDGKREPVEINKII